MSLKNEDREIEAALKNFRASVHAWSEAEFSRPRSVKTARQSGVWRLIANPVLGWGLAAVLVVGGGAVPVAVHHERQVAAQRLAAIQQQQHQAAEAAARLAQNAIDDEELLKHVDSDIAQAAPDAMQPLASLMGDSAN